MQKYPFNISQSTGMIVLLRRLITVFTCSILSLLLFSCGGSNPAGPEEISVYNSSLIIGDSTYNNTALSFAFNAPHGWTIRLRDKSKGEDSTLLASCTKELPALPYDGQLDLTVSFSTDSLYAPSLIGELTSLYLNDTSWSTITIDSSLSKKVGEFNGVWFEFSGTRGTLSVSLKVLQFIFKAESYNVLITLICPSSVYEVEKSFIAASFQSLSHILKK